MARSRRRLRAMVGGLTGSALAAMLSAAPGPASARTIGQDCGTLGAQCFQLNAVSIEGSTVYKPVELMPLYRDYLTREVSLADLTAIATAITDKYRADGYILSRAVAPPQAPGSRAARIRVYEGYVSEVDVTGPGALAARRHLDKLPNQRPLRLSELDRRISLAGDEPGLNLKTHFEPDLDDPARHKLVAAAENRRVSGSAYIDNRGSKNAGPWQAYLRTALNSALKAGDQLALAVLTVPFSMRAFTFTELSYALPIGDGPRLRASLSGSRANDGPNPLTRSVGGESWAATLGYLHPLWRSRRVNVWTQIAASKRGVDQDWTTAGSYRDEVVALRGMISATFTPPGRSTNLFAQVSTGERENQAAAFLSRADASKDFSKLNLHASHYRDIGKNAGIYLAADGQWTRDRLLASEEFIAGGAPYGRGYNYAEISGDRGIAGTAELRAGFRPKTMPGVSFIQGYGFVDAGKVWNEGPRRTSAALASAGVGMRMRFGDRTTLGVEAARPLTRVPYERNKAWRPFIYLSTAF